MIWIPQGEFRMGSVDFYLEEQPVHTVTLDGFWIDPAPVTWREFARFIDETGYVTVAEQDLDPDDYPGIKEEDLAAGSLVFRQSAGPVDLNNPGNWWQFIKGANWRQPLGRVEHIPRDHPVVQVAYKDVMAYADWCGKSLPTEAEWEYAARGGLDGAIYPWGNTFNPDGRKMANTWEGDFPWHNTAQDGFTGTSPVRIYPANGFGLFDVAGNVWEWTQDWWSKSHPVDSSSPCCVPDIGRSNPRGGSESDSYDPLQPEIKIPRKVLKGGSHLCAPTYCLRYRPAARIPQMIDSATSHIGFRCIVRNTG